VHQSSELWLKLAWSEVEEAAWLIAGEDLAAAIRLLRRANDCLKLVTSALDMLEHTSAWEYTTVRKVLGHGSGFDPIDDDAETVDITWVRNELTRLNPPE
jgi:tryptophan 2,3-dioxygenase